MAALLLAAVLACSLSTLAVSRGALSPPWFDQRTGPLHLVGFSTWNASCPPYSGCDPTLHEAYVVWLIWAGRDPNGTDRRAYRLISLPIAH